jgi:hypothetical protein
VRTAKHCFVFGVKVASIRLQNLFSRVVGTSVAQHLHAKSAALHESLSTC